MWYVLPPSARLLPAFCWRRLQQVVTAEVFEKASGPVG